MAKTPSTSSTRKSSSARSRATTTSRSSKTTSSRSKTTTKATVSGKTASSTKATATPLPQTTTRATTRKVPSDVVVTPELDNSMQPDLRKKELVDLAVDRSGVKKRDAKPAIEAALAILGEALEAGRSLQLPPLGRVKVQRSKELDDGQVIVAKVRRKGVSDDDEPSESNSKTDGEGLAKAAE